MGIFLVCEQFSWAKSKSVSLCAHTDAGMIAEYNANGKLIWSLDGLNKPRNVSRYDNGNLSVVLDIEKRILMGMKRLLRLNWLSYR